MPVSSWYVRSSPQSLPPDSAIVPSLVAVSTWAGGGGYEPGAVSQFVQVADYYLVAHSHAHGFVTVTHEVSATLKRTKENREVLRTRSLH